MAARQQGGSAAHFQESDVHNTSGTSTSPKERGHSLWGSPKLSTGDSKSPIGVKDDDADERGSIVSLESDGSTNGPFFWYRVVSKFSPGPRNCHTATMVGNTMVVFGGFGGSKWFDEVWTFDTHDIDWNRPEVLGSQGGDTPPPRYAHSAVSFRGLLYVFGGYGGDDNWLGDLWALDTQGLRVRGRKGGSTGWFRPEATGSPPGPRAAHTATVAGHRIWVFGGNTGEERMNDLHSLDSQTLVWKKEVCCGAIPSPRAGHTMSLVSQVAEDGGGGAGKLLLFAGGDITHVFNDLYSLDMDTLEWRLCKTSGTPPAPRAGHCTEVLPDGVLLVWGGGGIERVYNDLHLLDPRTMSWSGCVDLGKMVPETRVGHSMCARGSEVFIFGGGDSHSVFGDLIVLDTDALSGHWAGRRGVWDAPRGGGGEGVLARAAVQPSRTSPPPPQQIQQHRAPQSPGKVKSGVNASADVGTSAGSHQGAASGLGSSTSAGGKASAMQDRYRELDHKLHNRPSKADLEHLNILKGRNGVEPNIHAAQQRLMMRKRGTALEMKLHKRPNFNQLVRHNIIPEEDEYIEHEIRLWGHVPGVCSASEAIENGLTKLEDLLGGHIESVMGRVDALLDATQRGDGERGGKEGVGVSVRAELEGARSLLKQQVKVLKALAANLPPAPPVKGRQDIGSVPPPPPPPKMVTGGSASRAKLQDGGDMVRSAKLGSAQQVLRQKEGAGGLHEAPALSGESVAQGGNGSRGNHGKGDKKFEGDVMEVGRQGGEGSRESSRVSEDSVEEETKKKGGRRRNTRGAKKKHPKQGDREGGRWASLSGAATISSFAQQDLEYAGRRVAIENDADLRRPRGERGVSQGRTDSLSASACSDMELEQCHQMAKDCAVYLDL